MVRSMTGYGRGEAAGAEMAVTVELKSVNHRFFECSLKCPKQFSFLEDKLKSYIQSRVSRGKIDVFVTCDNVSAPDSIEINEDFAEAYINAAKIMAKKFKIKNDITVSSVASNPEALRITKRRIDENEASAVTLKAAESAVDSFIAAREAEGRRLAEDVVSRTGTILKSVDFIESQSPVTESKYREKIEKKIKELLGSSEIDEQRVITETAIFADRIAVNEETVRLRSHISHLTELLNAGGVIGKKLDFIVQEMNREANTIGSKCQDIEISKTVVDMKSEIEKIREQIQNIE